MKGERTGKILGYFLKDYLPAILFNFSGFLLIVVFYTIATGHQVEIVYPFLLFLFVFAMGAAYYFFRYLKLYRSIEEMQQYDDTSIQLQGKIEEHVMESMWRMHRKYMEQMEREHIEKEKEVRFISMMVHIMKTPVTVNDLVIQRIQKNEIAAETGVLQMKEENDRLLGNLNQTLDILRLEEFQKDYVPEPIELLSEIRRIINQDKKQFIYNQVYPKVETSLEQAWILSDRKWNELMIEQLISNAIKYSKDGTKGKHIYFEIERKEDRVQLVIRDEGIGIPSYDMGKIFEPFFTGENGRKGYSSSGIGLYFCKEVATCLGAGLEIVSEQGKGTSAILTYLAKL